ncbi:hypothetical protein ALC60_13059 [Trachymyrmex zeteki]|uniref:Uncharacterized protein n=1 Tax=Mycetomoellerius zeteki TaxID=64791 RepID=A0A151WJ43_9HYME|nr:hypothetical protein ALC60_13059 [Trachymyrmex zeteki]
MFLVNKNPCVAANKTMLLLHTKFSKMPNESKCNVLIVQPTVLTRLLKVSCHVWRSQCVPIGSARGRKSLRLQN